MKRCLIIFIFLFIPLLNTQYFSYLMLLPGFVIGFVLSVVIHELGHLVFGLLSGYKFVSYRVFFIQFEKYDKFRITFVPSTILIPGQCLMQPTNNKSFIYNLGGLIFTYVLSISLVLLIYLFTNNYISLFLYGIFVVNTSLGIINSIYNKDGINDICNLVKCRNEIYLEGFLYQLDINANILKRDKFTSKFDPLEDVGDLIANISIYKIKYYKAIYENKIDKMNYYYELLKKNYNLIKYPIFKLSILIILLNHSFIIRSSYKELKKLTRVSKRELVYYKRFKEDYQIYSFYKNAVVNKEQYDISLFEKYIIEEPINALDKVNNKIFSKIIRVYNAYLKDEFTLREKNET